MKTITRPAVIHRFLLLLILILPSWLISFAQPSNDINTYVLFAYEQINFKGRNGGDLTRGVIEGGNVGVNSCNIPNTKNLNFGNAVTMPTNGTYAVGYNVNVDNTSDLWQLYAKTTQVSFNPADVLRNPPVLDYSCPIIAAINLPVFPPIILGVQDVTLEKGAALILAPGSYNNLWLKDGSTLNLLPGVYHFANFNAGKKVKVMTVDGVDVRVAGEMIFNNNCYVGPSDAAKFSVRSDGVGGNDATIAFSQNIEFHGQVFAPNGRINLGNHTDLFGRFWANKMSSDFNVTVKYRNPDEQPPCPCVVCNNTVVTVDQNVNIDFNTPVPTYSGDPDLLPFFTFDKSGPTPDTWKAIFSMGANKLSVKAPAAITVSAVNGYAPGIVFKGTCSMEVENGAAIRVTSFNRDAGDILFEFHGDILINGEVTNEVKGTLNLPGKITGTSKCGNIYVGGLVQILGVDTGGETISLTTCGDDCVPGDIVINGLVKSYAHAHAGDLTLNRPNIKVVSLKGGITINAASLEPLYDEFSINGGLFDLYGGLLSWARDNVNPGKVEVQAKGDIIVNGHGTDPTGAVRKSWGAIAAIATSSDAPGGLVDVRSLEGRIVGNDRAFDVSGRNRLATNFAVIKLWAKKNIELNRVGGNNTFNPVVNASGNGAGDKGGSNFIRSFTGSINIGANAVVTALAVGGTNGTNSLTSCTGVTNAGSVTPPDANPGDDINTCAPTAVEPMYTACVFGARPGRTVTKDQVITKLVPEKITLMQNYPNPFRSASSIGFQLPSASNVKLSVYDASGREVMILANELRPAGTHYVDVNAAGLRSGVYYYKLEAGEQSEMRKMLIK